MAAIYGHTDVVMCLPQWSACCQTRKSKIIAATMATLMLWSACCQTKKSKSIVIMAEHYGHTFVVVCLQTDKQNLKLLLPPWPYRHSGPPAVRERNRKLSLLWLQSTVTLPWCCGLPAARQGNRKVSLSWLQSTMW